jgi:hypothetical protein
MPFDPSIEKEYFDEIISVAFNTDSVDVGAIGDSGIFKHAWTEMQRTETGFEIGGYGRSGTTSDNWAISVSGGQLEDGTICRLYLSFDADGNPQWTLQDAAGGCDPEAPRFSVHQKVTDEHCGFDWVRFH